MPKKVYYDATNNKEVVDIKGTKTSNEIEAMGLTNAKQMVEIIDETAEATEVVDGVLQKFDIVARASANETAREIVRQAKEDSIKIALGITDQEFLDLKDAMGL